jgi:hypothetical protein
MHEVRRSAEAAMRLVVRYLLVEFSLAWALVLAGFIRAGVQIWPFFANTLRAGLRRRWRLGLGLLIGVPVVAGWPLLFWLVQERPEYDAWLQAIAIPWWLVLGGIVSVHLVARAGRADPVPESCETGCRCGTCVARETHALSS